MLYSSKVKHTVASIPKILHLQITPVHSRKCKTGDVEGQTARSRGPKALEYVILPDIAGK